MPTHVGEDWSDSEDENTSEIETSVLLGIPDGEIDESLDLLDVAVSRIGGFPVFLPSQPLSFSGSHCKQCSQPMPLLVQMWCPFEGSAMDRVLYLWCCERSDCQRKEGSIRAWRGLKFNRKYAEKLEKKKTRKAEKSVREASEQAKQAEEKRRQGVNPFSASGNGPAQMTFGLGTQLFGGNTPSPDDGAEDVDRYSSGSESDKDPSEDGVESITKQLDSATLDSGTLPVEWSSSPSYKAIYLSTVSEYIPPPRKSKGKSQDFSDDMDDGKKINKDWGVEGWESSADVDGVFGKFVKRTSIENEQCVRYDLNGTPLPFSSRDDVYERLFPPPPPAPFTTKPAFAAPIARRRIFDANAIDCCGACGTRRVFECQLMPNLINVLRHQDEIAVSDEATKTTGSQTDEDRGKDLEIALRGGMGWGTCFVFSCAKDCTQGEEELWREELVIVQWDI